MARRISVEFDVVLPDEVTEEQIQEWLEYELGQSGQISKENPLVLCDIEAEMVSFASEVTEKFIEIIAA